MKVSLVLNSVLSLRTNHEIMTVVLPGGTSKAKLREIYDVNRDRLHENGIFAELFSECLMTLANSEPGVEFVEKQQEHRKSPQTPTGRRLKPMAGSYDDLRRLQEEISPPASPSSATTLLKPFHRIFSFRWERRRSQVPVEEM